MVDEEIPQSPRRAALAMKVGLMDQPIVPHVRDPLLSAWRVLAQRSTAPGVVRSSALVEDRFGPSFAGQFKSYLGLESEAEDATRRIPEGVQVAVDGVAGVVRWIR